MNVEKKLAKNIKRMMNWAEHACALPALYPSGRTGRQDNGKRRRNRKLTAAVMLTGVCLLSSSCTAQTGDAVSDETVQTEERTEKLTEHAETTEPSTPLETLAQDTTEAVTERNSIKENVNSEEKVYTLGEVSQLLNQQQLRWEAYYDDSRQRIDLYCEDGTKLLFLYTGEGNRDDEADEMILVMRNDQFFKQGFQKARQIDLEQSAKQEYYPQTAEYYLSENELKTMDRTGLSIAFHEIYARHGGRSEDPFLQALFGQKTWYHPKDTETDLMGRQDTFLNEYEKENVKAILAMQRKRGFAEDLNADYKVPRSIVPGSSIDLDGDGTREDIVFDFIYAGPYQMVEKYMVMINPKVPGDFKIEGEIDKMPPVIYAASLDGKTTQLIMSGKMKDGKPRTDIYTYQNGQAILAGQIDADNLEIMADCFWAYQYDEQQVQMERVKYIYKNGTVTETAVKQAAGDGGGNGDNRMAALIAGFDFERSRIGYSEVIKELERIGIGWKETPSISGERMDLLCDDGTVFVLMRTGLAEKELIMAGDRLSEEGFQRAFVHEQVAEPEEYYYPDTSSRLLNQYELREMNQTDLSIARNEIYARHGRCFTNPFLKAVFSRKSWYKPKYDGGEFSGKADQLFNRFEKENILLLVAAEKELAKR